MRVLRIIFSCFAMWFGVMALQDAVRGGAWEVYLAAFTISIPSAVSPVLTARDMKRPPCCGEKEAEKAGHEAGV